MEVRSTRAQALVLNGFFQIPKKEMKKLKERLANELIDAFENKGNS